MRKRAPWLPGAALSACVLFGSAPALGQSLSEADRVLIEEQIDAIEEERDSKYSLGGPIATLAVGGGMGGIGLVTAGYGALISLAANSAADDATTGALRNTGHVLIIGGLGTATVGAGLLVGGVVWLNSRVPKRRPYNDRIDELESQLEYGSLIITPIADGRTFGLGIQGTF